MTSDHHAPYVQGFTHATMAGTTGCDLVRGSGSLKTGSGATHFHDLTGGVYKARERIHRGVADPRLLATPPSRSRVAGSDPN